MITATMSVSAKKMPSLVSSVFRIRLLSLWSEVHGQKLLHEWIAVTAHLCRCADGQDVALVHQGNAVRHAKGEIAIVRHDDGSDLHALFQIENLLSDDDGADR